MRQQQLMNEALHVRDFVLPAYPQSIHPHLD